MIRLIFITSLFLILSDSIAQVYIIPKSVATNSNSCTNEIVIETYNLTPNASLTHDVDFLPGLEVNSGDTIPGFCYFPPGAPTPPDAINYLSSNGYIGTFEGGSTLVPMHLDYTVINYQAPSSSQDNDGSMEIQFDSIGVLDNYTLLFDNNSNLHIDTVRIDSRTMKIDSISEGYFAVNVTNPLDDSDYADFRIIIGDPDAKYVNTGLDLSISFQHSGWGCDGWILLQGNNLQGTYGNVWDNDDYSVSFKQNLCPGIYSFYSFDFHNGQYVAGSIDTVVLINGNNAYIDSSLFAYPVQDTTYVFSQNCTFDYNAPIDSIQYFEDTVFSQGGIVIVNYDMIMYQDSNIVTVSDSLVLADDSLVMLDVVIYCEQLQKVGFQGQRILYLRGVDDHHVVYLSMEEKKEKLEVNLFPVPTRNRLTIQLSKEGFYQYEIYNSSGIQTKNNGRFSGDRHQLDLTNLASGFYFLKIEGDGLSAIKKFVKD